MDKEIKEVISKQTDGWLVFNVQQAIVQLYSVRVKQTEESDQSIGVQHQLKQYFS